MITLSLLKYLEDQGFGVLAVNGKPFLGKAEPWEKRDIYCDGG